MTDQFVPHKKQETIVVKISKKEADLLVRLRRYPFGKFVVHKANNILVRIEIRDSQLIDGDGEIDL